MNSIDVKLDAELRKHPLLAIAFSGGCDSAFLVEAARRTLGGEHLLLVLADSPLLPRREFDAALAWTERAGLPLAVCEVAPLERAEVRANTPERCYHCKRMIFGALQREASLRGFPVLADGTNCDDLGDYRPGLRAAEELGVLHPLLAAGFTKAMIRERSREWGLSTWDLPAAACLASRIPTGTPLSSGALSRVEAAEELLRRRGFRAVRVRDLSGKKARIELPPEELSRAEAVREELAAALAGCGYSEVELALYRTGSMNRPL